MKRKRKEAVPKRSAEAKALADPLFKPKVVKPKKGKGAYTRRPKHPKEASGGSVSGRGKRA